MPRDYRHEYDSYHGKPEQIKNRNARNRAREIMRKKHGSRINGKDIHHIDMDPTNNKLSNLSIMSVHKNRAMNQKKPVTEKKKT